MWPDCSTQDTVDPYRRKRSQKEVSRMMERWLCLSGENSFAQEAREFHGSSFSVRPTAAGLNTKSNLRLSLAQLSFAAILALYQITESILAICMPRIRNINLHPVHVDAESAKP